MRIIAPLLIVLILAMAEAGAHESYLNQKCSKYGYVYLFKSPKDFDQYLEDGKIYLHAGRASKVGTRVQITGGVIVNKFIVKTGPHTGSTNYLPMECISSDF
jgi:hypothetical protein